MAKDCSQLSLNLTQIAMNLASSDSNIKTFDDVVKAMQVYFPDIRRVSLADAFVEATTRQAKESDEDIERLMRLRREPKLERNLRKKIDAQLKYSKTGIKPEIDKKAKTEVSPEIQNMRDILAGLKKEISKKLKPTQKQRLEKSIAELERRLKDGDLQPRRRTKLAIPKELEHLQFKKEMLQREIREEVRNLKPKTWKEYVGAGWDLFRMMMPTGEFSFGLRQGGIAALTHPGAWANAMKASTKAFFSAKSLYRINNEVFADDLAPVHKRAKLSLLTEGMSLTQTEEALMNYWAFKIPVLRNFDRAAIAFFNVMRSSLFNIGYNTLGKNGEMTDEEAKVWANWVNVSTGRGNLGDFERATVTLNRMFFSARYVASRFEVLGGAIGQPVKAVVGKNKRANRLIAKEYARLGLGLSAMYGALMAMMLALIPEDEEKDISIEKSPLSSDFGKLRVGKRRLDPLMGLQQPLVFLSRIISGKTKNQAGVISDIRGEGKKWGTRDVKSIITSFARSKLSPQGGAIYDMIAGEDYFGRPLTAARFAQLLYPMTWGDIYDVMKEDNIPVNTIFSALAFLGMGMASYQDRPKWKAKKSKSSRTEYISASNTLKEAQDAKKWLTHLEQSIPYTVWEIGEGVPERVSELYEAKRKLAKAENITLEQKRELKRLTSSLRKLSAYSKKMAEAKDKKKQNLYEELIKAEVSRNQ